MDLVQLLRELPVDLGQRIRQLPMDLAQLLLKSPVESAQLIHQWIRYNPSISWSGTPAPQVASGWAQVLSQPLDLAKEEDAEVISASAGASALLVLLPALAQLTKMHWYPRRSGAGMIAILT